MPVFASASHAGAGHLTIARGGFVADRRYGRWLSFRPRPQKEQQSSSASTCFGTNVSECDTNRGLVHRSDPACRSAAAFVQEPLHDRREDRHARRRRERSRGAGMDDRLSAAGRQGRHLCRRLVPVLPAAALVVEQRSADRADGERLARSGPRLRPAAGRGGPRRRGGDDHGRPDHQLRRGPRPDLCRRDRGAAPGQARLRALFRRAETPPAAYRHVGDQVLHRHARRHARRRRADRPGGAGDALRPGTRRQRLRGCERRRGHGYDHRPRLFGNLHGPEVRRLGAPAGQRHGPAAARRAAALAAGIPDHRRQAGRARPGLRLQDRQHRRPRLDPAPGQRPVAERTPVDPHLAADGRRRTPITTSIGSASKAAAAGSTQRPAISPASAR